jgi:hypothetical protein
MSITQTGKAWLLIAAVVAAMTVIGIVVVVVAGGDNQTEAVATGAPTDEPGDEPGSESSPSTAAGRHRADRRRRPNGAAVTGGSTHHRAGAELGVRRPGRRRRGTGSP